MAKYLVQWTKGYYASGIVEIEADTEDDAHDKVMENIGNYEGNLQYDEFGESVEVLKEIDRWLSTPLPID